MTIEKSKDGAVWARRFEDDTHVSNQLAPGTARKSDDLVKDRSSSWMCGSSAAGVLEALYGEPDASVGGKYGRAEFRLFDFKGKMIAAVSEGGGVGTSWRVFTGEKGSRYGASMLLPCDKECSGFWPDFCMELTAEKNRISPAKAADEDTGRRPGMR